MRRMLVVRAMMILTALIIGVAVVACKSDAERRDELFQESGLERVRPLIDSPGAASPSEFASATPRPSPTPESPFPTVVSFSRGSNSLNLRIATNRPIDSVEASDDHNTVYKAEIRQRQAAIFPIFVLPVTVNMSGAAPLAKLEVNGTPIPLSNGKPEVVDIGGPTEWNADLPNVLVEDEWIDVAEFVSVRLAGPVTHGSGRIPSPRSPVVTHTAVLEVRNSDYNAVEVCQG